MSSSSLRVEGIEMFNKILITVDHSKISRKVFEAGLSLAKQTGASLMLLHVLSPEEKGYPSPPIFPGLEYSPNVKPILKTYEEQCQIFKEQGIELLHSLAEEAEKAGIMTKIRQREGYTGRTICELAQTWSAELILVGSRGLTGLKEMLLGSISNYVTHHAPCSVLIVREDVDELENNIDR